MQNINPSVELNPFVIKSDQSQIIIFLLLISKYDTISLKVPLHMLRKIMQRRKQQKLQQNNIESQQMQTSIVNEVKRSQLKQEIQEIWSTPTKASIQKYNVSIRPLDQEELKNMVKKCSQSASLRKSLLQFIPNNIAEKENELIQDLQQADSYTLLSGMVEKHKQGIKNCTVQLYPEEVKIVTPPSKHDIEYQRITQELEKIRSKIKQNKLQLKASFITQLEKDDQ